ncbi:hypothetical protein WT98_04270 [Burkholderia territorii]|nr:hypothetical protein WT98_04270 [Burkholderia territorii]
MSRILSHQFSDFCFCHGSISQELLKLNPLRKFRCLVRFVLSDRDADRSRECKRNGFERCINFPRKSLQEALGYGFNYGAMFGQRSENTASDT